MSEVGSFITVKGRVSLPLLRFGKIQCQTVSIRDISRTEVPQPHIYIVQHRANPMLIIIRLCFYFNVCHKGEAWIKRDGWPGMLGLRHQIFWSSSLLSAARWVIWCQHFTLINICRPAVDDVFCPDDLEKMKRHMVEYSNKGPNLLEDHFVDFQSQGIVVHMWPEGRNTRMNNIYIY